MSNTKHPKVALGRRNGLVIRLRLLAMTPKPIRRGKRR